MRLSISTILLVLTLLVTPVIVSAHEEHEEENLFSASEVAEHNTTENCWVILNNTVYDITDYLKDHSEKFLDISGWCGQDITEDFTTKAGSGEDHTGGYNVIEKYSVGVLTESTTPRLNLEVALTAISIAVVFGTLSWIVSKRGK